MIIATPQRLRWPSHFFGQSSFSNSANVVESSLIVVDRDLPLEKIAFLGCGTQTEEAHEELQRITGGRGVDFILNTKAFQRAGLARVVVTSTRSGRARLAERSCVGLIG